MKFPCEHSGCDEPSRHKNSQFCPTHETAHRRIEKKRLLAEYMGGECERCGWYPETELEWVGFDFHHVKDKEFSIGDKIVSLPMPDLIKEADKCSLLCAICHRIVHSVLQREV